LIIVPVAIEVTRVTQARILIVEDEFIVARDLQERLRSLGYAVAGSTGDAAEAIRLAADVRPDLVLMDIRLRGDEDGVTAADEIQRRYDVPVIYLTAYADDDTLARARVTEPYGYILKPFEERELRTVIEIALYRHQADSRLRQSEARFKAFMDNSPTLAFIKDAQGRYVYANQRWEEQFPQRRCDWQGKTDGDFFPPETAELFQQSDHQVIATKQPMQKLETGPMAMGETRRWLTTKFPLTDAAGQPVVAGLALDVTETMRLEEHLRQVAKMEAIGRLAGGVAHDFNNLLQVIGGYASLLVRNMAAHHPWHPLASGILQASEQAGDLTRQLLAFSRKQVLQPRVLDLNRVVGNMHKMLSRLLGQHIQLVTQLDPRLGSIRADPGQLEQVIVNLAVNARDAMPNGGSLTFTTANIAIGGEGSQPTGDMPAGCYRQLIVRDTGCGMEEAVRARVFEPFFTTKEAGQGTGLGLATVYGIIKQSNGHVEVSSQVGHGTTFTIYLPATEELAPVLPSAAVAPELPRGTETILLVEDLDPVRMAVAQVLRGAGYVVLTAANGAEALDESARHAGPIHLLLSDLIMPGLNAQEVAERLSRERPGLKVVFLSGYPGRELSEAGIPLLHELIQKPFLPLDLTRKVREVLDR
jgi:PAS domain S-box-containing protein